MSQIQNWSLLLLTFALPIAILAGRVWLKSFIEGRVKVGVERQIEAIRTEIRQSEERLKSDLRMKESQIAALVDGALGGRAARVTAVETRQLEAINRLWIAVTKLSKMKGLAMTAGMFKFDALESRVPKDEKLRKFLADITDAFAGQNFAERAAEINSDEERPYLSEYLWALYSAYAAVILGAYTSLKILSISLEKSSNLMNREHASNLLKAALPNRTSYIDQHGAQGYYYLLDEIENNILSEIKNNLNGVEVDQANLLRSAEILKAVAEMKKDNDKLVAAELQA